MMKKTFKLLVMLTIVLSLVLPGMQVQPVAAAAVSINKTKASIFPGETVKLSLKNAEGKIKWSTSDEVVATVGTKGKVTAVAAGTATITAKNNGIKYSCKVTVKEPKLNKVEKTVLKGNSFKLTLLGDAVKKYSSKNTVIAKVSSTGKVTGVNSGTTTIVVEGESGKKYTCTVTVKLPDPEDHKHIVVRLDKVEPTCEKTGLTSGEYCALCGEIITPQLDIPALGHNYVNGYCKVCKQANPEEIHEHVYMIMDPVEATCISTGLTDGVYCATCNQVFKAQKTVPALGHNLVAGTCTRCKLHFHEKVEIKAVAATCLVDGSTAGTYCKHCGEFMIPVEVIKAPGSHKFGPDGHCERCTADRNGHIHEWVIEKAVKPTCEDCGLTEGKYCPTCGYREYAQNLIIPTGHIFVNGKCRFCGKAEK